MNAFWITGYHATQVAEIFHILQFISIKKIRQRKI